jgi:hypothetical protein
VSVKEAYSHKGREKIVSGAPRPAQSAKETEPPLAAPPVASASPPPAARTALGEDKNRPRRSFTSATFVQDGNEK